MTVDENKETRTLIVTLSDDEWDWIDDEARSQRQLVEAIVEAMVSQYIDSVGEARWEAR